MHEYKTCYKYQKTLQKQTRAETFHTTKTSPGHSDFSLKAISFLAPPVFMHKAGGSTSTKAVISGSLTCIKF